MESKRAQKSRGDWITIDTDRISHGDSGHSVLYKFMKSIDKIEDPVELREIVSNVTIFTNIYDHDAKVFYIVYEDSFWYSNGRTL